MQRFMWKKILYTIGCILLAAGLARAQEFPRPTDPPRLVNDFAGMLTTQQRTALENKLVEFDRSSSTQIAVITVDDLQGLDVSDYAARIFDAWGIGGKGKDNGILILVKPKTPDSAGQVFISTGYGLEGAVPDALAGRIVDYDLLPEFRSGNYYGGLDKATTTLIGLTRGEFTADEYIRRNENEGWLVSLATFVILIVVFLLLSGRRKRGYNVSRGGGVFIPPVIIGGGRGRGGGFGGFTGGGGGFGGFGGGFTGGGGAGGSW